MPRAPACLTCPVVELCATRGEMAGAGKARAQKKREIHYALDFRSNGREGAVFLVRRARDARLMAGMWELPEVSEPRSERRKQQVPRLALRVGMTRLRKMDGLTEMARLAVKRGMLPVVLEPYSLRHSITVTDYTVRVWRMTAPTGAYRGMGCQWNG